MRNRFDQIGKKVLRGALELGGAIATQLEIPSADAQAVDTWFEPAPGHEASLERAGVLGRMASGPTMFEMFSDTPSVDDVRSCLRKQLALDHSRVLEAQRQGLPRPPFPTLSCISSGRPESVLYGYALTPKPSFPSGFYEASEAWAVGVVALRELRRDRTTLLLRLLGAGAVLKEAVEDLARLPKDAWERQVAMPALLAVRIEIPQDSSDESEREYLMSTQNLYEEWEHRTREQGRDHGREQEAKRALTMLYEARFRGLPPMITEAVEAMHDIATLERWLVLVGTRSQEEVAAAMQADTSARSS